MNSSKRIVLNTTATYTRTIISIVLVLFSSRWVLSEMGFSDYGVFSLIGSLLIFISFLNNVLASADARFFAIEIGRNGKLHDLFKSSLIIHLFVAPILILIGGLVGYVAIVYWLNIPPERIDAAVVIFFISLITIFFSMVSVPFRGLFIAHQNILASSVIDLFLTLLNFGSALALRYINYDKLISYSLLYSFVQILICLVYIGCACYKYPCSRQLKKGNCNRNMMKSILKFSFWSALGDLGHLARTQGTAIIVNVLFSTTGNAALGIANQVSSQASGLSNSLMSSTSPEIYRLVGITDFVAAKRLAEFINKIAVLLMMVLGLPLLVNIDEVLRLWLIDVPPFTSQLCICFIIMFIIERYTMGNYIYMAAINKISTIQLVVFCSYSLSLVLPYLGLCHFLGITGIGVSCIIGMLMSRLFIWYSYNNNNNFALIDKNLSYVFYSLVIFAIGTFLFYSLHQSKGWLGVLSYSIVIDAVLIIAYFVMCFTKKEKYKILSFVTKKS